jgi:hypothetical protein
MKKLIAIAVCLLAAHRAGANEPPSIEHQPTSCTDAGQPISLCATIVDDVEVARARLYFRRPGEKYYVFAEMSFRGLNYCGTIPAPLSISAVEYYMQAIDNEYEATRTSTYRLEVKPAGSCDFPPIEKDPERRSAIKVHATDTEQGIHLPRGFDATGVTFVPATPYGVKRK